MLLSNTILYANISLRPMQQETCTYIEGLYDFRVCMLFQSDIICIHS